MVAEPDYTTINGYICQNWVNCAQCRQPCSVVAWVLMHHWASALCLVLWGVHAAAMLSSDSDACAQSSSTNELATASSCGWVLCLLAVSALAAMSASFVSMGQHSGAAIRKLIRTRVAVIAQHVSTMLLFVGFAALHSAVLHFGRGKVCATAGFRLLSLSVVTSLSE